MYVCDESVYVNCWIFFNKNKRAHTQERRKKKKKKRSSCCICLEYITKDVISATGRMPWFSSIFAANYVEHINWVPYFAFASTFWCMLSSLPVLKSKVCDDGNKIITILMQAWINSNITFSMYPSSSASFISFAESCACLLFFFFSLLFHVFFFLRNELIMPMSFNRDFSSKYVMSND